MNGICPDLVQALQSSRENEGDSERLRIALNGVDLLAVDPAGEMLMVMRAASVHVKNGRPQITMICQRGATGNEYRDWQQSGSVPLIAGDAGSNPAVGAVGMMAALIDIQKVATTARSKHSVQGHQCELRAALDSICDRAASGLKAELEHRRNQNKKLGN